MTKEEKVRFLQVLGNNTEIVKKIIDEYIKYCLYEHKLVNPAYSCDETWQKFVFHIFELFQEEWTEMILNDIQADLSIRKLEIERFKNMLMTNMSVTNEEMNKYLKDNNLKMEAITYNEDTPESCT